MRIQKNKMSLTEKNLREKKFQIKDVIVDSKSGISGAGKKLKIENLFAEISENFFSYGIESHKHYPEIDQEIRLFNKQVSLLLCLMFYQ